jgi:hypothetical protein
MFGNNEIWLMRVLGLLLNDGVRSDVGVLLVAAVAGKSPRDKMLDLIVDL